MSAPPWRVEYRIAGHEGVQTGIEVAWSVRVSLYAAAESSQSATMEVVLNVDARAALRRQRASLGSATLYQGAAVRMSGPLREVEWEPVDGGRRTLVRFTLRDSEADDRAVWPLGGGQLPERRAEDPVQYRAEDFSGNASAAVSIDEGGRGGFARWSLRSEVLGDIPAPSDGQRLPYVFGTPGKGDGTDPRTGYPATPAYFVGETAAWDALGINDGRPIYVLGGGTSAASTVTIWGPARAGGAIEFTADPATGGTPDWIEIGVHDFTPVAGTPSPDPADGEFAVASGDTEATAGDFCRAVNDLMRHFISVGIYNSLAEARMDPGNASRVLIRKYVVWIVNRPPAMVETIDLDFRPGATCYTMTPESGVIDASSATSTVDADGGLAVQHSRLDGAQIHWTSAIIGPTTGAGRGNVASVPEEPYYAGWEVAPRPGGAGDVLSSALFASTVRIDIAELMRLRPVLNAYRLAGYIDDPVSPLEWVRSQLVPILPIEIVPGPFGLRPVLVPGTTADTGEPGVSVVAGQGIARGSPCRIVETEPVTTIEIAYARRADTGSYSQSAVLSADTSPLGLLSQGRGSETVSTDYVHDAGTAMRIAQDRMLRRATSGHEIRYSVTDWTQYGPGGTVELYAGRRIRLTDTELGLSAVPAIVSVVECDAVSCLVTVETIERVTDA